MKRCHGVKQVEQFSCLRFTHFRKLNFKNECRLTTVEYIEIYNKQISYDLGCLIEMQTYILIGKHELRTSSNLFPVIGIHDINAYNKSSFCRPSNVPGAISLMLLLDSDLRWENKVGLKQR